MVSPRALVVEQTANGLLSPLGGLTQAAPLARPRHRLPWLVRPQPARARELAATRTSGRPSM
jgi:hypothetical protein